MSKIIRNSASRATVMIGERRRDTEVESRAAQSLGSLFPMVSVLTAPDGSRLIPLEEVLKIEQVHYQTVNNTAEEARKSGYETGYREGLERGRDEARKVLNDLNAAISDAVKQRQSMLEEAQRKILELVIKISKKVTFGAIEADPEITAQMIAGVVQQLIDRSQLKVKVHPDHLPIVEQNIDRFLVGDADIKNLSIEADPRVRHGGCFIETPNGDIDARLDSQFEVLQSALQKSEDE